MSAALTVVLTHLHSHAHMPSMWASLLNPQLQRKSAEGISHTSAQFQSRQPTPFVSRPHPGTLPTPCNNWENSPELSRMLGQCLNPWAQGGSVPVLPRPAGAQRLKGDEDDKLEVRYHSRNPTQLSPIIPYWPALSLVTTAKCLLSLAKPLLPHNSVRHAAWPDPQLTDEETGTPRS